MGQKTMTAIGWASDRSPRPIRKAIWAVLIVGLIASLVFAFKITFSAVTGFVAFASVAVSIVKLAACLTPKPAYITPVASDEALPKYTILVPLFHEANMIEPLLLALEAMDYPRDKLQILLICEAVDPDTVKAVQDRLRPPFDLVIVPPGVPQTKPRALNYAMQFASGDLITIYDAEDHPHSQQLRQAAAAFRAHPKWQALQAPLDYFNANDNWLTRQFALEYAALFHVWVPFLARLNLPFPLGGTSNHMRRAALEACGGWDAHNVTEDADLSFRIAAHGGHIGYINLPTDEEAVSNLSSWTLQRSRWIKGFMQSWSVHMRAPFAPGGLRGLRRFMTLQLTLGFTLLAILFYAPTLVFMALWSGAVVLGDFGFSIPPYFLLAAAFSIGIGVLVGVIGVARAGKAGLITAAIWMPLYWLLLFRPAVKALREMRSAPFFWHKTLHGVSARPSLTTGPSTHPIIGEPIYHESLG